MELLERFIDHPNRDQLIAREMGWTHLLNEDGAKWAESVDESFREEMDELDEEVEALEEQEDQAASFELHHVRLRTLVLRAKPAK